jgi:hypothetical protein
MEFVEGVSMFSEVFLDWDKGGKRFEKLEGGNSLSSLQNIPQITILVFAM